tara:strand:+ start:2197 stop:2367 length:171 start_codon:yes stop_codon:yes gene_type:complete
MDGGASLLQLAALALVRHRRYFSQYGQRHALRCISAQIQANRVMKLGRQRTLNAGE